MRMALRGVFWVCFYAAVVVAPLAIAAAETGAGGRSWITEFSVALGFIGLTVMVLQFGLVARFQRVAAPFGMDALLQYHRQIGFVALAFVLAHPVLLFVEDPDKLSLLYFPTAPNRARFATGAVVALLALVGTSVWRRRLHLSYEAWQTLHAVLAIAVVGLALAHAAGVDYYVARPWQRSAWMVLSAVVVGLFAWVRLIKPLIQRRHPWKVVRVEPERGGAWTVVLAPDGHAGLRFIPGQFCWVTIGRSPLVLAQHPFSFSSSAERTDTLSLTIKERGDFTSTIGSVQPGTRAYVDGPYGMFSPDRDEGQGFVLIAGGVGITPLMSILRTMVDREDVRPVVLVYGSPDYERVIFRDQLDELCGQLSLTVVHVIEKPAAAWDGETGYIDEPLLRRHLPAQYRRFRYFVCGPAAMMDAMEHLLVALGVPDEHVNTERFEMV